MVDKNIEEKLGLNFAKLLVEVKIGGKLPDMIYFRNEKGLVIEQRVTYDWKPMICDVCHKYGHSTEVCRKNKVGDSTKDDHVNVTETTEEQR